MKEKEQSKLTIKIPQGSFEGNCIDCKYADWSDTKSDGSVYCYGPYGGYNKPGNRNGCFHYKER